MAALHVGFNGFMAKLEYFPQFYRRTRPYAGELVRLVKEIQGAGGLVNREGFNGKVAQLYLQQVRQTEGAPPPSSARLFSEMQGALCYADWLLAGGIIYEFDDELVRALDHSDPGEMRLSDMSYPYDMMYLSFGHNHSVALENGAKVTGAYLINSPGTSLRVTLTAQLAEGSEWWERNVEIFDMRIPWAYQDQPLNEAIDRAISDDVADFTQAVDKARSNRTASPQELATFEDTARRLQANQVAYRAAVQLIVNGLCFVTTYGGDVQLGWQAGTPEKWVEKTQRGTPKEQARAQSKLKAMGYSQVRQVGCKFAEQAAKLPRSAHWRRGHWRRQPYGPRLQLRRLRWIQPTAVLGGVPVSDSPRVYEVSEPS